MNIKTKIATASLSAVALAGIVGAGVSYADDPTTSPSPSASPSTSTPGGQQQRKPDEHAKRALLKRALLKRALHGEVTLGGKKARVIDFQRGTVEKVSATAITVKSTDGFTGSYVITEDTRIRQAREPGRLSDITTGDKVRVIAVKDGKTSTAKVIREPKG